MRGLRLAIFSLRLEVGRLSPGALARFGRGFAMARSGKAGRARLGRNRGPLAIGTATQPLTANAKGQTANRSGFVLWEMLLGLAIFCMGAIALTMALQQAVDTVILIHDESEVRQDLESIMAEVSVNKLQPGKTAIFMADHRIQYEREVISLPAKNWKGQPLANLWQVTVRATWLARNRVRTSEAQEFFFQP